MSFPALLAERRAAAATASDIHLLVLAAGMPVFACDLDGSAGVRAPIFCRTTDPDLATCPGCVAAGRDN